MSLHKVIYFNQNLEVALLYRYVCREDKDSLTRRHSRTQVQSVFRSRLYIALTLRMEVPLYRQLRLFSQQNHTFKFYTVYVHILALVWKQNHSTWSYFLSYCFDWIFGRYSVEFAEMSYLLQNSRAPYNELSTHCWSCFSTSTTVHVHVYIIKYASFSTRSFSGTSELRTYSGA